MAKLNIPEITIEKAIKRISHYFSTAINQKKNLKQLRVPFLWGPPGIGKSEAVYQIAGEIEKATGKRVAVRAIYLPNCSMVELLGIPTLNGDGTLSKNVTPEIFQPESDPDTIILAFFDEFNKASRALLDAALQIILNRQFWVHKFPENSIFIAAGNPNNSSSVPESDLRPEMNDRFRHYNVQPNFGSWKRWALMQGVNRYVLDYLYYDNSKLYDRKGDEDDVAFPTPRSWKYVSDYLNLMGDEDPDFTDMHHDICGDIGLGTAIEFEKWCRLYGKLPTTEEIFLGENIQYPRSHDVLYTIISSMLTYMEENQKDITPTMYENACRYVNHFPMDFATLFYKNVLEIKDMKLKLINVPAFQKWMQNNKHYI